uniref:DUF4371 domain-containing protein n=1 Tax=Kalanchoe fedtschenkoi TaxID=63787 RepID=A0A7N0VN82_KALFE
MSSTSRIRKYISGYEKLQKKKKTEDFIKSQQGALDKFVVKESQISSENESIDVNLYENHDSIKNNVSNDVTNYSDTDNNDNIDLIHSLGTVKGPKKDMFIQKGPKNKIGRRFSSDLYTRILGNMKSKIENGLYIQKSLISFFCFCCKIFEKGYVKGGLVNEGYEDWSHIGTRLQQHEVGMEHKKIGLFERDHWKNILVRIISIVKFLAKHSIAFCGIKERLYENNNGNFLGLIEMLAELDPVMQEHVRRSTSDDVHFHYLGHNIQNELISLIASSIKFEIIKKVRQAKYFSIILDCIPDVSHQEQMSMILRFVDLSSSSIVIEESFLGFITVNDTTGQRLFDVLLQELKLLDLDGDNVRGQGYDNGSNMKGRHQGVQKKLLDVNPRAFYTPCGCHSLNLMLCDMANTCSKARDFFGVIQRIYTIFANSTKRWQILKKNVKELTLKSLSSIRWESRVDSVKAIRFQIGDVRQALLQVSVNVVSKSLQSVDMLIDVAFEKIEGLIAFLKEFRETSFSNAIEEAKKIVNELDIDPIFPHRRQIRRKKV